MNDLAFYTPVPQELLSGIVGREPMAGVDPILSGY